MVIRRGIAKLIPALIGLGVLPASEPALAQQENPASPTATLEVLPGFDVPFDYNPPVQPFIVVKVKVNGSKPLPFLIDTGCSFPFVIDKAIAAKMSLPRNGKTDTIVQGNMPFDEVTVKSMQMVGRTADATLQYDTAHVGDLSAMRSLLGQKSIAGILGYPVLVNITSRFDFSSRVLTLYIGKHAPYTPLGAAALRLISLGSNFDLAGIKVGCGGSTESDLLLDTGSVGTDIPRRVASSVEPRKRKMIGHGTIDGSYGFTEEWLIEGMQLGSHFERNVPVGITLAADPPKIGLNVLRRFRMTLDPRNKLLTLEVAPDYSEASRLEGKTGISLERQDGRLVAETVDKGSPADKADIAAGDTIESCDGISLSTLSTEQARDLLSGIDGAQAELEIVHKDNRREVKRLTRTGEFDDVPASAFAGLCLWKPSGKDFTVEFVGKGTAAERAGLRVGDLITGIDGKDAEPLPVSEFRNIYLRDSVELKVIRGGEKAPLKLHVTAR